MHWGHTHVNEEITVTRTDTWVQGSIRQTNMQKDTIDRHRQTDIKPYRQKDRLSDKVTGESVMDSMIVSTRS